MMNFEKTFHTVWLSGLGLFVLAALTGFMYRLGLLGFLPDGLSPVNIRHAHSHLMFFGWVTPVPMLFIAKRVATHVAGPAESFKKRLYSLLILGLLTYPFFLLYGYESVSVGAFRLPVAVILSGLIMINWYWYIGVYLSCRNRCKQVLSTPFFESAMVMLFISSLGAWGVALLQMLHADLPLMTSSMTHFFLAVFTEGWCVLIALGLLYETVSDTGIPEDTIWRIGPIVLGVPLTFPFGLPVEMLNVELLSAARAGAFLVAVGLLVNLYKLMSSQTTVASWAWRSILFLLGAKIVLQMGSALMPADFWLGEPGLRILYLHIVLLGFVSLTLFAAWHHIYAAAGKTGFKLLIAAVFSVLVTLVLISGFWPANLLPSGIYEIIAFAALLPVLAAILEWAMNFSARRVL